VTRLNSARIVESKDLDNKEKDDEVDAGDKALFTETWGIKEGDMRDQEILLAIKLGHL
jgi:hypothetical protein